MTLTPHIQTDRIAIANTRPRLSGLEVSRGFAALSVVLFHLMVIYLPLPEGLADKLISSLSGAVPFFFALSSFSLCLGYGKLIISQNGMERFYVRRLFRILPLFYFMLLTYCIRAALINQELSLAEIAVNAAFLFPFFPGKHGSIVWAGWSLGVEWLFYMIFPVAALLSRNIKFNAILFLMLCVATISVNRLTWRLNLDHSYYSMNAPANLVYFQAGIVVYAIIQSIEQSRQANKILQIVRQIFYPIILVTIIVLLSYRFLISETMRQNFSVAPILACVCMAWIISAYAGLPNFIDNTATRYLGRLSYGIYLIHPLVLWAMAEFGTFRLISSHFDNPLLSLFLCTATAVPIVIIAADTLFRVIERPAILLGEKLLRRP